MSDLEEESKKRAWDYYIDDDEDEQYRMCKRCKPNDSYEYVTIKPEILTNVSTLKEMASVAIAVHLWNRVDVPRALSDVTDRFTSKTKQWKQLSGEVLGLITCLDVAKPIAQQIGKSVCKMTTRINEWVSYHYRTVFFEEGSDKFLYNLIRYIVWNQNGRINCVKTARNLIPIMSPRFGVMEKFRLLCVYCMKCEMDQMTSALRLDIIRADPSAVEHPIVWYWYCYYADKFRLIRQTVGYVAGLPIDVNMFRHPKVDNWHAKMYFFDRLCRDDQVKQAIWLIGDDEQGIVYQKAVMLKLDESQRKRVYKKHAVQIMLSYAHPRINSTFLLHTWLEVRGLMRPYQFFATIRALLQTKLSDNLLMEIWSSATEEIRKHALSVNDQIVEKALLEWKWGTDCNFVFALLEDLSTPISSLTTKEFFTKYCDRLLENSKFQMLDRFLDVCFPDAEDLRKFKVKLVKNSPHVEKTCWKFYSERKLDAVNNYLHQLLTSYPDVIAQYKKNLITSSDGIRFCVSIMYEDYPFVDRILNDCITVSILKSKTEVRKKIIFSSYSIIELKKMLENKRLGTDAVDTCIDYFLTETNDKNALKEELIGDIMELMVTILRNNDATYFQTFMLWCFGNEAAVKQFRNMLDLDAIFTHMLKDCLFKEFNTSLTLCKIKRGVKETNFKVLNEFLKWYFMTMPAEIKVFKKRFLRNYEKIDVFETLSSGNRGNGVLKVILDWFLKSHTAEERKKFKKIARGKVAAMLKSE